MCDSLASWMKNGNGIAGSDWHFLGHYSGVLCHCQLQRDVLKKLPHNSYFL